MKDNTMTLPNVHIWEEGGQSFIKYDEGVLDYEVQTHGDFPNLVETGGEMTSREGAFEEIAHYKHFFRAVDSSCVFRLDGSISIRIVGEKYLVRGTFKPYRVIAREQNLLALKAI